MSKSLKAIYKDLLNNNNLHDNIPKALQTAVDKYYTYAIVRLALFYYTYYEMYCDEKGNWSDNLHEYIGSINGLISEGILQAKGNEDIEKLIRQIDDIRKNVSAEMEILTLYVDLFKIYEYALNRIEYRFKKTDHIEDDEEFARMVLRYIFDSEDNVIVNDRIQDIIGQLPIRITRKKYFDYLRSGFNMLAGASTDVWKTLLYIIRSSADLDIKQDTKDAYPMLWDKKEKLENLDYKEITKDEYEAAALVIQEAAEYLQIETTAFYGLAEIVNEVYTLLLCIPYMKSEEMVNSEQRDAAFHILRSINEAFLEEKQDDLPSEILNKFEVLEGVQEYMEHELIRLEDVLYHIDEQHKSLISSLETEKMLQALLQCKVLHSGSLFADMDDLDSDSSPDSEGLSREVEKLIKELDDKFQRSDRMIIRAIMANTIDKIPVFFDTHTEIMEYVLYALNRCTDIPEKYASIEIIKSFMEQ
ncbi:MAG TPA: hypothetical protein GX002_07830 [Clostridiales bacterium]|nr:hypothetical protein [Clostridiales bacterium]